MKTTQAILFFGIVFSVYGLINYYLIKRVLAVTPSNYKNLVLGILIFAVAAFIAGRILENYWVSHLSDFLVWVGSFWIAIMFYTLLCLIIIDSFRIINHFIPFFPQFVKTNPDKTKKYLNIVMVSDVHLGTIYGKQFAYKIQYMISQLRPDIILLAGDIIDEDIKPVLADNIGDALYKLEATYGIYGITGNHEYIGGVKNAVEYLSQHNITMLRDTSVLINNSFYLVGREDYSINRFSEKQRKPLAEIVKDLDFTKPVIMMDHQPFNLEQARQNGIDLQLSGHTHNGQLWPFNHLIEKIYDLSWGYKLIDKTHYYVSCGVGGWGPPVRTGSRPEIVNLKLHFIK